ncbi:hypothetical protein HW555_002510 [Spodoptera exigua]|uniref:Uncharacterized protein n=1 Tax=Spodoptera exigua TaxID=7107 RepID=A0A835L7W4_SPOEX|nr:hypothetical protein HW555_002510 [Spodoptera exigua]
MFMGCLHERENRDESALISSDNLHERVIIPPRIVASGYGIAATPRRLVTSTADEIIEKDRNARQSATRAGRHVAGTPKRGFFGTIFHVILEQINDTKSAYNQISDLVNSQFADDNAVTTTPDPSNNGTTETPKITRAEFLKILDRFCSKYQNVQG